MAVSDSDTEWCKNHLASGCNLEDALELFEAAQVLSTYDHLAAVLGVEVEALAPYKAIVERGRLIAEHEFFKQLQRLMLADDKEAIKLYAEMVKLRELDKSAPITAEEQLTADKVRNILKGKS